MIPSTTNKLLVAEDWTKIYQSFKNADFKSYDFETLKRTMISYLRERYPEDFNDYIESSEYVALIDLIAFLGQNLSFRVDLNARENFLETAERRESVLRLARLISYNTKRNIPANGFLKITNISTTDIIFDNNGLNLANSIVTWNDSTNTEWYQQFIAIMNSIMPGSFVFGKPQNKAIIDGIDTERYNVNSLNTDVPVYAFTKIVNGTSMNFEVTAADFSTELGFYEQPPLPGNQFSLIYKNDNRGFGSSNSGFFVHFRQGTINLASFNIDTPITNEIIGINAPDINDIDVWLWQLNNSGNYEKLWTKVNSTIDNNVIYNSISNNTRTIYSVLTRENDQIDLNFADGVFGDLPKGTFRLYYRQSNGLSYIIKPEELSNISIQIPYLNKQGQRHQLTLIFSLQYTVNNAQTAETNAVIKSKAPQVYYTQNRMITAEDYNIAPLAVANDILKIKSINRISSGISKYYELSDVSGKYSKTDIFATDGVIYKNFQDINLDFSFTSRNEIIAFLRTTVADILRLPELKNFYYDKYDEVTTPFVSFVKGSVLKWTLVNQGPNQSRGYFESTVPESIGTASSGKLSLFLPDTLVKFTAPSGQYFLPNGTLTSTPDNTTRSYIWSKIIQIIGDGSNSGLGALSNGTGPVVISKNIPSGAEVDKIIPRFINTLQYQFQLELANIMQAKVNFGLTYIQNFSRWDIITEQNLNVLDPFSLTNQKSNTNTNLDSSWLISFVWTGKNYQVKYRTLKYVFESLKETAFFVDNSTVNYDFVTNTVVKDQIKVLDINQQATGTSSLNFNYSWQIDSAIIENDGYINPTKVQISFFDETNDGAIDNPESFEEIVNEDSLNLQTGVKDKFIFFEKTLTGDQISTNNFISYDNQDSVISPVDGQLYYFYDIDTVKLYSDDSLSFVIQPQYFAYPGRANLKFQYVHNSSDTRRLDPSKTNIIDIYLLSNSYDTEFRNWLSNTSEVKPLPPTTQSFYNQYSLELNKIKSISDEIIFHPVRYKILFGAEADMSLQAIFKAVKNPSYFISDNDIKSRILTAINNFFAIENWDFGQTFYFSELSTYVMNIMTPYITNFVIVPKINKPFGNLYEISCLNDEIFISSAKSEDIEVISSITGSELKIPGYI
jgi:hypothetical protein